MTPKQAKEIDDFNRKNDLLTNLICRIVFARNCSIPEAIPAAHAKLRLQTGDYNDVV